MAHSRSWLRGSWSEEADGAGSRRRTEVPRGKRMRSPGGYEMQSRCCAATCVRRADAVAGRVRDAQGRACRRGRATEKKASHRLSLSLRSLSPLFFAGSLSARSLSFSLCCCFYLCLLRKGANPSRALLSFPRRILLARGFPSRAGSSVPAQAPRPLPRAAD